MLSSEARGMKPSMKSVADRAERERDRMPENRISRVAPRKGGPSAACSLPVLQRLAREHLESSCRLTRVMPAAMQP